MKIILNQRADLKGGKMHKEKNLKYDESEKFKDIKSENIKIRDVLPEDAERIQGDIFTICCGYCNIF